LGRLGQDLRELRWGRAFQASLARLLALAAPERGWRLALGHVDHALRPGSGQDARFVAQLAEELGAAFFIEEVTLDSRGRSLEEAARQARREALMQMAAQAGAEVIALGHTAGDQAETVMMRLLNGTGLSGLAAMRPWSSPWWRPLLGLSREELRAWLQTQGHPWREDESNQSLDFLRNRVRHQLLPLARELVNPRAEEALARLATLAAEEEELWQSWCREQEGQVLRRQGTSLVLRAEPLAAMHPARQRRLLRHAMDILTGRGSTSWPRTWSRCANCWPERRGASSPCPMGSWPGARPRPCAWTGPSRPSAPACCCTARPRWPCPIWGSACAWSCWRKSRPSRDEAPRPACPPRRCVGPWSCARPSPASASTPWARRAASG
ncbi:MAG: tRNA lysidine(34) synthetase TilS, partial [Proteobacteria bacterium]|nr:tRNA lysidine(34) synthetase TilS [Pseudomonadota bacterium]